jgi:hypothetical protein
MLQVAGDVRVDIPHAARTEHTHTRTHTHTVTHSQTTDTQHTAHTQHTHTHTLFPHTPSSQFITPLFYLHYYFSLTHSLTHSQLQQVNVISCQHRNTRTTVTRQQPYSPKQ